MTSRRLLVFSLVAVGLCISLRAHAATPQAGIFNSLGERLATFPEVAAGSSVAFGDVDDDGVDEIVTGTPPGVRAQITVYELDGTVSRRIYPYAASMMSGINIAVGDVTGKNTREIVVVPRQGDYARVQRYNSLGRLVGKPFYCFGQPLTTGATIALADVNGDNTLEIICGIGPTRDPDVNVFNYNGNKLGSMTVYERSFKGGVSVTALDYNDDGKDEIVVAPLTNRLSDVKVIEFPSQKVLSSFRAYGGFRGGVALSANTSGGGKRILMGAGKTGGPHVRQVDAVTRLVSGVDLLPIDKTWRGGITVAFMEFTDSVKFFASAGATSLTFDELVKLGAATPTVFSGNSNFSYEKKSVAASSGIFTVNVVRVNLLNPKLKITSLTAGSKTNCFDLPCAVKSLKSYMDEAGGKIAINGSYFCPSDYASCNGIAGSFYWLWYNTHTDVFSNSYQNQFNNGPVVAFDTLNHFYYYKPARDWQGKAAFESATQQKLRAAISNGPNLVFEGKVTVTPGELDNKQLTVKSSRSGIGFRGDDMYLVVASGATVVDLANVMKSMGMQYAMNLDGGGSSALIYEGAYKVGPGRNMPNALIIGE